jgi:hypothetical protein
MRFDKYLNLFRADSATLLTALLPDRLRKFGYNEILTAPLFTYAPGEIPIMLVAHVDTVHRTSPELIVYDREQNILWSPTGLGADDRAGVAGIIELVSRGFKPHVLFLDLEETGCVGARSAAEELSVPDVRYLIELDRRGSDDCVFYDCGNEEFMEYVENFGFTTSFGSFTDICELSSAWDVASVNLSTGYYNEHTLHEHLKINEWLATINSVAKMLENPPVEKFPYMEVFYMWKDTGGGYSYPAGATYWSSTKSSKSTVKFTKPKKKKSTKKITMKKPNNSDLDYYADLAEECINSSITAEELSDMYGGSPMGWGMWLQDNGYDLEVAIDEAIAFRIETMGAIDEVAVYDMMIEEELGELV